MMLDRMAEVGRMTPTEEKTFWIELESALANDDGEAARQHLAAGRFITYRARELGSCLVREWPDGRREVIEADLDGYIKVLREL